MFCPFCGPLLCLEVKCYRPDMTQNGALLFHQFKKKQNGNNTCKNLWIHPRQTSIQQRKNGGEAQAPLGTQPEGVSCLSGTCSESLYSGLLLPVRKQSLTVNSQTLPFPTIWWNISSRRSRPNWLGQFVLWRVLGWGVLTSTAEHRETWSSQQDAFNVTSSVGTRGSSTVHSDSSWEEKKFYHTTKKKFSPKARLTLQGLLEEISLACFYKRVFELNITNRYVGND